MVEDSSDKKHIIAWYTDEKKILVVLVILATVMSLPYFRDFNIRFTGTHPALLALLGGAITTAVTYLPMKYADPKYAFSGAVLLGLLVAEMNIFGALDQFPTPVVLSFFFFMYFFGRQEADLLWPDTYKGGDSQTH